MCVAVQLVYFRIYFAEYASVNVRKYGNQLLTAGVLLLFMVSLLHLRLGHFPSFGKSPLVRSFLRSALAGLVMGVMIFHISSLTDDVVNAVPQSLKMVLMQLVLQDQKQLRKLCFLQLCSILVQFYWLLRQLEKQ